MNAAGQKMNAEWEAAADVVKEVIREISMPAIQDEIDLLVEHAARVAGVTEQHVRNLIEAKKQEQQTAKNKAVFVDYGEKAKAALQGVATAMTLGTGAIVGYATAGFYGSAMGQVFSFQMEQLSRVVGGLFGPELQKMLDLLASAVSWMRSLSDETKKSISFWVQGALAASAMTLVLPRLAAGISGLVMGVKALSMAFLGLGVTTGGLLPLLGLLVGGLTFLMVGTDSGRAGMSKLAKPYKDAVDSLQVIGDKLMPSFDALAVVVTEALIPTLTAFAKVVETTTDFLNKGGAFESRVDKQSLSGGLLRQLTPLTAVADSINRIRSLYNFATTGSLAVPEPNRPPGNRGELSMRMGGFESLDAVYYRIAQASIMVTAKERDHQRIVEDQLRQIAENTAPGGLDGEIIQNIAGGLVGA